MINAVYVPRLNANEDELTLSYIDVAVGQKIGLGEVLFEVESDKSVFEIESEHAGYVLALNATAGNVVGVGTVVLWIGDSMEEKNAIPDQQAGMVAKPSGVVVPTLKAMLLITENKLSPADIPAKGDRITVEDVDAYLASHSLKTPSLAEADPRREEGHTAPLVEGRKTPLTPYQKAMVKTVSWQYREACATYLEIIYNHMEWKQYTDEFAKKHRLMLDPMLSLMAHSLVREAAKKPLINSTVDGGWLVTYNTVNIGFTVEAKGHLFLLVVEDAGRYGQLEFVRKLGELQKKAFKGNLEPRELTGATIAFTSLAKRGVSRHIPILPPGTALMVSHAAPMPVSGKEQSFVPCVLGATYDHRVLDGSVVAQILGKMAKPADEA